MSSIRAETGDEGKGEAIRNICHQLVPSGGAMSKGALLKEERFFNMSLEEKERAYLGNMQIPAERK